jgi:vitamin B12 transporter
MRNLFLFFLFLCVGQINAQTTISGNVVDSKENGIPGANVFIKDTYDGTTTDINGKFSFTTSEKGMQTLSASFIGFESFEEKINLDSSEIKIKIRMKDAVNELKTVTIAAGAFEASDEKKMVILRPLDIVTTAGAGGDIYGALQTLPGTGVVGEKEGMYVRGGDANEAKTFIDGLLVDNPYFTSVPDVPQRGRFSPFLFKGVSFSTGGYSAQYGQAMSSALILESQDLTDRTQTNIGVMSVGASLGHTKRWKRTSVGVFGSYTDLRPYYEIFKQNRDWVKPPQSINGSAIFRHKTSETGMLKAFVSYTWTDLSVYYPDTADPLLINKRKFANTNTNLFSSFSYKEILFKTWTLYAAASFGANSDNIRIDEYPVDHSNYLLESRLTLTHSIGELSVIRFGGEFQKPVDKVEVPSYSNKKNESYEAVYAEGDIYITQKIVARAGLRGENSALLDKVNLAPRVSLAYKTGQYSQVSFACGKFYQVPLNTFLVAYPAADFKYEEATHYIFNFQHVSDLKTFRVETYYKKYNDLTRTINNVADNSGYGYAKGFELFYRDKKSLRRSDFWISYSYLDTKRLYLDYPVEAMPTFAAKHNASLVFKYFIPKLSLAPSLTYVFSTGRHYYNPNNPVFLGDQTKNYHNLSLNFSYLTSIGKSFTVVVLSIGNLFGVENVYTYNYSSDGSHRYAVGPTAPRMIFAGLFINIGSQSDDSDKYN